MYGYADSPWNNINQRNMNSHIPKIEKAKAMNNHLPKIVKLKVFFDRSRMYVSYIQFFMIGIMLLQSFKDTVFGVWVFDRAIWTIPLSILIMTLISITIGYLDLHLGIFSAEQKRISERNPVLNELNKKLDLIIKKI